LRTGREEDGEVESEKFKVGKDVKKCKRNLHRPLLMPPPDLIDRTRLFALAVLDFCGRAPRSPAVQEAASQLRRAANSVRSNYRSARKGRSRAEFLSKLYVAFQEADECVDWLEYMRDGKLHDDPALLREAREPAGILAAAARTARRNADHSRQTSRRPDHHS
jgi:four helix bundle protein